MKKILTLLIFLLVFSIIASASTEQKIYKSVSTEEKKIALTFDDGPHPKQTIEILSILEDYGIQATFFIVGKNAEIYPDILRQISEEGHEIGNHTFSHVDLKKTNKNMIKKELQKTHDKIFEICEYNVELLRPPGGSLGSDLTEVSAELGYKIVLWNIDTKDWTHDSIKSINQNILKNIKNGSIILFHDYISNNSPTAEVLRRIIPELQAEGYKFVTVGELIKCEQQTNAR